MPGPRSAIALATTPRRGGDPRLTGPVTAATRLHQVGGGECGVWYNQGWRVRGEEPRDRAIAMSLTSGTNPPLPGGRPRIEASSQVPSAADRQGLEGISETFAAATRATGETLQRSYRIAGDHVVLRFAGEVLIDQLTPALEHLRSGEDGEDAAEPALTVHLWDSESTGTTPPPLPLVPPDSAYRAFYYYMRPPHRAVYQPGPRALSALDGEHNRAWYWVERAGNLGFWEQAKPLRHLLEWWLAQSGRQTVHGAAVGVPEGGVLLVGKGGSGKSTTALACLASNDLLYAGDDYVAVSTEPSPWVHSLYSSGNVHPDNLHRVPHLRSELANAERLATQKAVFYAVRRFGARTTAGFPLRAVFISNVSPGRRDSRIIPTTRAAALTALAPSTIFQSHPSGQQALGAMREALERVPAYVLELGCDVAAIPPLISSFLSRS